MQIPRERLALIVVIIFCDEVVHGRLPTPLLHQAHWKHLAARSWPSKIKQEPRQYPFQKNILLAVANTLENGIG
ncbi:unnamed protein product [Clavelina lepadiformis]|uniref:Secreted protein n=1 Tax=Clavelina lepadiformis TaxID=159417 RepID=A0ABP0EXD5_CLALP